MIIRHRRPSRSGLVLIIVTVVILLVSLGAVGLITLVQTEYRASRLRGDEIELENVAAAGRDYLAFLASQPRARQQEWGGMPNNRERFWQQRLVTAEETIAAAHFTIASPAGSGGAGAAEVGPVCESGKLHLQQVLQWEQDQPGAGFQALMALPGMTAEIADGILDWIDPDSTPRSSGREADGYASQGFSYQPRNAVPPVLDELLLIPGISRELLWGYPARTGDGAENASGSRGRKRTSPQRTAGSRLNPRPWRMFLTVSSAERNENFAGQPRIFLNMSDLPALHQLLSVRLGVDWANFVVAYRQYGPARRLRGTLLPTHPADFRVAARFKFKSELDLVGGRVPIPGETRTTKAIQSPLQTDQTGWRSELSRVLDEVTIDPQPILRGRIHLDVAPREVLSAIPGLEVVAVDQIVASRGLSTDPGRFHRHPAWLVEQGIIPWERLGALLPMVTTSGDVWSAEVSAAREGSPLRIRDEFLIDATVSPPRLLYCKDLRDVPLPPEFGPSGAATSAGEKHANF